MARTTRETLCTNGFVSQRKNGFFFFRLPRINYQNGPGPDGADPSFPGRPGPKSLGPLCAHHPSAFNKDPQRR